MIFKDLTSFYFHISAQSANATQGGLLTTYVLTRNLSKDRLELNRESLFEGGPLMN